MMTRTQSFCRLVFSPLLVFMSGCLEIETTSTVNTDGSIQRVVQLNGDSTEVLKPQEMFPTDSTWTFARRHIKDSSWTSTASKVFTDGAALEKALNADKQLSLHVRIQSTKRFLWFTTEYTYRETILSFNQFHAVPLEKYISPSELEGWLHYEIEKAPYPSVEDSLRLKKSSQRAEEWDSRNKFESYYGILEEGASKLTDSGALRQRLSMAKETLYTRCAKPINDSRLDTLPLIFQNTLKDPRVSGLFIAQSDSLREFEARLVFQQNMLATPYKSANVVMPGLIVETNAPSIEGNKLTWKEFLGACYAVDYPMWARSRVINWWAVVLTGAVIVVLAGLLIVGTVRRRRTAAL
jgi:hypothetical protein